MYVVIQAVTSLHKCTGLAGCMSPRKSGPNTAILVGTQNIFSDVSIEGS